MIDQVLSGCRIVITPSVEEEVVVLGAAYPDGVVAGERIAREKPRTLLNVKDVGNG